MFVQHLLQDFRGQGGQSIRCKGLNDFAVLAILRSKLDSSEVVGGSGGRVDPRVMANVLSLMPLCSELLCHYRSHTKCFKITYSFLASSDAIYQVISSIDHNIQILKKTP